MRHTKTIFSILLMALLSCQNQTKNNQDTPDTSSKTTSSNARPENSLQNNISSQRYSIIQSTLAAKGNI